MLVKKNNETEFTKIQDSDSKVTNREALSFYKNLIKSQPEINRNAKFFSEEVTGNLPEEFNDFKLLENTNQENMETIYSEGDEEVQTAINYNVDTDTYSLFEANMNTGELVMVINEKEYTVVAEGENINMIAENGEVLPLLITEYEDTPEVFPQLINIEGEETIGNTEITVPQEEGNISLFAATTFGKEYGPFKKTNKTLVEILGILGSAGTALSFKIKHPVLGIVSGITGIAGSTIGTYAYKTLYIKYWQSHSTTNYTYVRERDNYYNYNNYTGFVKSRTWNFYSSRP